MIKNYNYSLSLSSNTLSKPVPARNKFRRLQLLAPLLLLLIFYGNDRVYKEAPPEAAAPQIAPVEILASAYSPVLDDEAAPHLTKEAEERKAVLLSELSAIENPASIIPPSRYAPDDLPRPNASLLTLSPETRAELARLRSNPAKGSAAGAKHSVTVKRGEESYSSPFNKDIPANDVHILPEERENSPVMKVEIKQAPTNTYKLLSEAHNALDADENESAIALYKEVLTKDEKNKVALFGLGVAYQRNKQMRQAREAYNQLLVLEPKNTKVLNNYLMVVGDEAPEEALGEFQRLASVNPRLPAIPAQQSLLELRLGDKRMAAGYMMKALELDPDNIQYKYNLAVILDEMGNREQAKIIYHELLERGRNGAPLPVAAQKIQDRLAYLSTPS